MNSIYKDYQKFPKAPSFPPANVGIINRLSTRKGREREIPKEDVINRGNKYSLSEVKPIDPKQRRQRYVPEISIPNSIIKANLKVPHNEADKTVIRKERDEYVKKLLNRLQPKKKIRAPVLSDNEQNAVLNKFRKDLQKTSALRNPKNQVERQRDDIKMTVRNDKPKEEMWEVLKAKPKEMRVSSPFPRNCDIPGKMRRSKHGGDELSHEFIRKPMDTSRAMKNILEVENITRPKVLEPKHNIGPKKTSKQNTPRRTGTIIIQKTSSVKMNKGDGKQHMKKNRKTTLRSENFLITDLVPVRNKKLAKYAATTSPVKMTDMESQTSFPKSSKSNIKKKESPVF